MSQTTFIFREGPPYKKGSIYTSFLTYLYLNLLAVNSLAVTTFGIGSYWFSIWLKIGYLKIFLFKQWEVKIGWEVYSIQQSLSSLHITHFSSLHMEGEQRPKFGTSWLILVVKPLLMSTFRDHFYSLLVPSILQSNKLIDCSTKCLLVFLESKMIEKHGGYKFSAPVVPSSFNFGGPAPGMNWVTTFLPAVWL